MNKTKSSTGTPYPVTSAKLGFVCLEKLKQAHLAHVRFERELRKHQAAMEELLGTLCDDAINKLDRDDLGQFMDELPEEFRYRARIVTHIARMERIAK